MILPIADVSVRPAVSRRSYRCRKPFKRVFQFRISLIEIAPEIWRRIEVPDCYSFWDLHCAITDSLGWLDYHLHMFSIVNPHTGQTEQIGSPDEEGFTDEGETIAGWEKQIADYFTLEKNTALYEYDFGDSWGHSVTLEAVRMREKGVAYPRCVDGQRACPPEDCGGATGYERFVNVITDPMHQEHRQMLHWVGGRFDPEWFDLDLIRFDNPDIRRRIAFEGIPTPKTMRQVQYHRLHQINR